MPVMGSPTRKNSEEQAASSPVKGVDMAESESEFEGFGSANSDKHLLEEKDRRMRKHFDQKLARIEHALQEVAVTDESLLKGCAARLARLTTEYEAYHTSRLATTSDELFEAEEEQYAKFERRHFELALQVERQLSSSVEPPAATKSRVKLPQIRLPSFDGQMDNWLPFRDTFISLIHNNASLSEVDKLQYLKGALTKEAQDVVAAIEITSANYVVVWDLLKTRYDNKKLIVKKYLDKLFTTPVMKKESYDMLIALIDSFDKRVKMMGRMGVQTDGWSELLAYMLCARLDPSTLKQWEMHHHSTDVPKYEDVLQFLRGHANVLQVTQQERPRSLDVSSTSAKAKPKGSDVYSVRMNPAATCVFCKGKAHSVYECEVFRKASVPKRYDMAKEHNLCFNCLTASHQRNNCTSGVCRVCQRKHHTMLHNTVPTTERASGAGVTSAEKVVPSTSKSTTSALHHCAHSTDRKTMILLPTVLMKITTAEGRQVWARALLDGGSQINIITESLSQRLGVQRKKDPLTIGGIGLSQKFSSHSVHLPIQSHRSNFKADWSFHVLRDVTWDLPSQAVDVDCCKIPEGVLLADPQFGSPGRVDLLIGREGYNELLIGEVIRLPGQSILLQNTEFGWIISGRVPGTQTTSFAVSCGALTLDEQLQRFWALETCQSPSTLSVQEAECERKFEEGVTRDVEGRFVVPLLTNPERLNRLGNSYEIAVRRLQALKRRLNANPTVCQEYENFLAEYLSLGHMQEVNSNLQEEEPSYYMPHHCILRPSSVTTKLRVVFDASCSTDTGISLNDALLIGPSVQDDLLNILLRFRIPRFVMVADIEKMYRQIWIRKDDQRLQRILWQSKKDDRIRVFQLKTVTYGTSSAPYLATKCLQELARQGRSSHPMAAEVLSRDFYMDDLLTGVESVEQGKELCAQLNSLLHSAGFSLRKWATNSKQILEDVPTELHDDNAVLNIEPGEYVKTLGLRWTPSTDQLGFSVPTWSEDQIVTKRVISSDTAKIFDPMGLLGPIVIIAKCLMQELWAQQRLWDDPLEPELQQRWLQYREELSELSTLTVPRRVIGSLVRLELHGFSDASLKAYGACVYLRTMSTDGSYEVNLLCAKSRVAPLPNRRGQGNTTLPRLELSGALLLCHVWQKVKESLKMDVPSFFWVDSTIVLHWLSGNPSRWKQFVANRVSEIQHLTDPLSWSHVAGEQNPADIISRGMMPTQLRDAALWWHGPEWLCQPSSAWPSQNPCVELPNQELEERIVVHIGQENAANPIFSLRSSFVGLVRLVAYLRRFWYNCNPTHRALRRVGYLRTSELQEATQVLLRSAQRESFGEEIKDLQRSGEVKRSSGLKALCPIIHDGVMRIGGRLRNAPVSYDRKHPIILAASHPLTLLIVQHYHQNLLHAGQQLMISTIREKYWPLRIRNLVRRVVHDCVQCFRLKPTTNEQLMGELPVERVTPTLPFLTTGVDLCGPLFYKIGGRKSAPVKSYVAIFVCMQTKAVHVELIDNLSTPSFIATLKRFVARRGKPLLIECDNATNFRGADRALKDLQQLFETQQHQHGVTSYCGSEEINFRFIPPRSPHFGGLWEAAVKSLKRHLKATIGNAVLQRDDLETLLVQVEACLNSRPLTQLTVDPEDLEVLTPGHFLVHRALSSLPEPSYDGIPENRLDRYQQTQEYVRRIWKRWSTEYLSGLQPRTKWTKKVDNIREGTMVLIKEDNLPPLKWRYGRVIKVYPGDDGLIRVVDVKSKDGQYRRAISRICVLPGQTEQPSQENGEN